MSWYFEKIIMIDKLLANLVAQKAEKTQINYIRHEKGVVETNSNESRGPLEKYT